MHVIRSDKPRQRLNSSRRCAANCSYAYESRRIVAIGLHASRNIQTDAFEVSEEGRANLVGWLFEKPVYQQTPGPGSPPNSRDCQSIWAESCLQPSNLLV